MARTFSDQQAVRSKVPLLIGLAGCSGSGKTFSALRLATGMQKVSGGDIYCIDTESNRATHYADTFSFRHVSFKAPHSPVDYRDALSYCVDKKAGIIIIDSLSHEHEGSGGVLEWHEKEIDRMAGNDFAKRERVKFAGWIKPKRARTELINYMVGCGATIISCFRAKPKMKIQKGKDPVELGFQPISGDEFIYEQTLQCLLYPSSGGIPTWDPEYPGENQITKLPTQFEWLRERREPLSEEIGTKLAEWAAGDAVIDTVGLPEDELTTVLRLLSEATSEKDLRTLAAAHSKREWSGNQRAQIKHEIATRARELAENAA